MKKIFDSDGNLLALHISYSYISKEKEFLTPNELDFQIATFNLKKETVIENHFHPSQERLISSTPEVIVVLDGIIEVSIFDSDQNLIQKTKAHQGDTIALFYGGHGIEVIEDCKLVETKQGPYFQELDKVRF